ncbi:MAG: FtsB family cell division protein [Geminicoccaceae bacterium]|jgi:cell division protein FtsB
MVANLVEALAQRLKGRWLALVVTLVLAYFGFHALHGRYGFLAWIDTSRELVLARLELAGLVAEREELLRDVQAFQQDSLDRDLLEEELRRLGYVRPNEVIILRGDQDSAR